MDLALFLTFNLDWLYTLRMTLFLVPDRCYYVVRTLRICCNGIRNQIPGPILKLKYLESLAISGNIISTLQVSIDAFYILFNFLRSK